MEASLNQLSLHILGHVDNLGVPAAAAALAVESLGDGVHGHQDHALPCRAQVVHHLHHGSSSG